MIPVARERHPYAVTCADVLASQTVSEPEEDWAGADLDQSAVRVAMVWRCPGSCKEICPARLRASVAVACLRGLLDSRLMIDCATACDQTCRMTCAKHRAFSAHVT